MTPRTIEIIDALLKEKDEELQGFVKEEVRIQRILGKPESDWLKTLATQRLEIRQAREELRAIQPTTTTEVHIGKKVSVYHMDVLRKGSVSKVDGNNVTVMMESDPEVREWPFIEVTLSDLLEYSQ